MTYLSPTHVLRPTTPTPPHTVEWTAGCDVPDCTADATWRQRASSLGPTRAEVVCPVHPSAAASAA